MNFCFRLFNKLQKQRLHWEKNGHFSSAVSDIFPSPVSVLTDDEETFKNYVAKIAKEKISPYVKEMEANSKITNDVLNTLFVSGLLGLEVSSDYGGSGCSFMKVILAVEEIAKVDPSVAVLVDIQNTLITRLIGKIGTKKQKETYLPRLATSSVGSFCLSEATSGSDAFALKTTAKKEGDHYLINGSKMWISNSDLADIFLVMANVAPEKGYKGITCFIADKTVPGITIGRKESKLGLKASGTHEIYFDNYKVSENNVLGEVGQGYKYTINYLNEGRVGIAAQMVGLAEGCFNCTVPYLLERRQFGQPLFNFQSIQHQIARLATEIEVTKLMVYNTARLVDAKKPFVKQAAMSKYFSAELAGKITTNCIDLMGGVGFTTDFPQEKYYRDCKAGTIYEGTTNIMLNTIIKHIKTEFESI